MISVVIMFILFFIHICLRYVCTNVWSKVKVFVCRVVQVLYRFLLGNYDRVLVGRNPQTRVVLHNTEVYAHVTKQKWSGIHVYYYCQFFFTDFYMRFPSGTS